MMKTVRVHETGGIESLRIETIAAPAAPGPGEVGLRVLACGINFSDTLIITGDYQLTPALPFAPGAEVCGIVEAVGEGVGGLTIGMRVIALPLYGGYAEKIVVEAARVVPAPETMDDETAAGFAIVNTTAELALGHKARLAAGETLVVHGASGGVGLAAVGIGKAMGARVIASCASKPGCAAAREHGADEVIDSAREDLSARINQLTDGRGADVIIDPVGGTVFEASLRAINFGGRLIALGFASGTIPQVRVNIIMVKNIDLLGLNIGGYLEHRPALVMASCRRLIDWYDRELIRFRIGKIYSLEESAQALRDLQARKITGKAVLRTGAGTD